MTPLRWFLAGMLSCATLAMVAAGDVFLLVMWTISVLVSACAGVWIGRARRIEDDAAFLHYLNGSGPRSIP